MLSRLRMLPDAAYSSLPDAAEGAEMRPHALLPDDADGGLHPGERQDEALRALAPAADAPVCRTRRDGGRYADPAAYIRVLR